MLLIEIEKYKSEINLLNDKNITMMNESNITINTYNIRISQHEETILDLITATRQLHVIL